MLPQFDDYQKLTSLWMEEKSGWSRSSRSSLHRYHHESLQIHSHRTNCLPILIVSFFLLIVVCVLCQIASLHFSSTATFQTLSPQMKAELKQMDQTMNELRRTNVLSIDDWRRFFHLQTYIGQFGAFFEPVEGPQRRPTREFCQEIPDGLSESRDEMFLLRTVAFQTVDISALTRRL